MAPGFLGGGAQAVSRCGTAAQQPGAVRLSRSDDPVTFRGYRLAQQLLEQERTDGVSLGAPTCAFIGRNASIACILRFEGKGHDNADYPRP